MYSQKWKMPPSSMTVSEALKRQKTTPDPAVLIEQRLDFSDYVPGGFGTADCVILADRLIYLT